MHIWLAYTETLWKLEKEPFWTDAFKTGEPLLVLVSPAAAQFSPTCLVVYICVIRTLSPLAPEVY